MSATLPDKNTLLAQLRTTLESRKIGLETALAAAKESRDNDTKSSAGDKFETGRAMMQQEMDKLEQQLHKLQQQLHQLQQIDVQAQPTIIGQGSLVQTDKGFYLLAIAYGKLEFDQKTIYVISTASLSVNNCRAKNWGRALVSNNSKALY